MATVVQTQVRCGGCNRRLADLVNEVEAGQVLVELKCPRCGQPHLEVVRPQSIATPPKASSASGINTGLGLMLSIASSLWTLAPWLGLMLMIATSVSSRAASAEPLAEQDGAFGAAGRAVEMWICELAPQTLDAMVDERPQAPEAPKPAGTVQALLGPEVGGTAATVGDTGVDAFCDGQEVPDDSAWKEDGG